MSTEATGDGQADAVGAVDPDTPAASPDPAATAVAEAAVVTEPADAAGTAWDMAPSAWGASEPAEASGTAGVTGTTEAGEAADAGTSAKGGEPAEVPGAPGVSEEAGVPAPAGERSETGEPAEPDELDEPAELNELDEPDEVDEPDEPGLDDEPYEGEPDETDELNEPYNGYADGEAAGYDEVYQEYDEYEQDEAVAPPRARRWPRVLLGLGFVVLAAVIVGGAIAIVGSVTHGFKKPVKVTYTKSALFDLKTGECFDPQGQSYTLISCDSPHVAEVFATFKLSGSKWPGATASAADASSGCATRLTGYLNPQLAISLSSTYVYPDSVAWQAGTRTVICEVRATSGDLTGSVRGASATAG